MAIMPTMALADLSDNFENGIIDSSLWLVGGGARGYDPSQPIGTGPWSYSNQEILGPDGYFQSHVWGPTSANSYGAEAWIRTIHNFNDGKNYTINFTWEPGFLDPHYNIYYIQVTDGYIPGVGNLHWPRWTPPDPGLAGTKDLLLDTGTPGRGFENTPSIGKVNWSISLDSSGVARLYSSPDASGSLLSTAALNPSDPWYLRFMVIDGTSAGFPAGDAWLNLYDFEGTVVPAPGAFALGAIGLSMAGWLTKRKNLRRST